MKRYTREKLQYMVGGLLYSPAINNKLADKICEHAFSKLTSMAFCLEDSICDEALAEAESELVKTLREIKSNKDKLSERDLPLLFIRIRTPEHMEHVHALVKDYYDILCGYILPKYDLSNCEEYRRIILNINTDREDPVYIMPILESRMIADAETRISILKGLKSSLDSIKEYVLNVRVGGNDFCNLYGLRRNVHQNIYQIAVIRDIFSDILNVFSADYVISGAVWEYFGTDTCAPWATGLKQELTLDILNGFVGKTAIHPCQLPVIYESLKVDKADYEDAQRILGWASDKLGVEKSTERSRMNEVKCHGKWASRIAALGEIYGIRET